MAGAVMDFRQLIAVTNNHQGTTYSNLKEKQKEALVAAENGDVVCLLPTGYGKTVVIQMLPFLKAGLPSTNPTTGFPTTSVLVVAPLNAILEEQQIRFGESCILIDDEMLAALHPGSTTSKTVETKISRFKSGDFTFLLSHPEKVVEPTVRKVLMSKAVAPKMSHIVIDESHCILSWGKSDFRPAFLELGALRVTLPLARMVALTATATPAALKEINEVLHMRRPVIVKASPDRPSVYLEVKTRPPASGGTNTVAASYEHCVDPLLYELQEKELQFPRTIVYMPLQWCGYTHDRALGFLRDSTTHQAQQSPELEEIKSFVAQYHAPQTAKMKSLITTTMAKPDSALRLLLATEAYGMGADCPNVRRVIHAGPPKSLETYVQEIGRCGRDGEAAHATLYYNNSDVADNRKLTKKMQDYCTQTKQCRREYLLEYFGFDLGTTRNQRCCDICFETNVLDSSQQDATKVNQVIRHMLLDYFAAENSEITNNCMAELQTGLCPSLARKIALKPRYYNSDKLAREFPFLTDHYIENIQAIIAYCL